jgi:transcription antitermination factor NusG
MVERGLCSAASPAGSSAGKNVKICPPHTGTSNFKFQILVKHWYAIYTTGRWEKKVHNRLQEAGVESYCPLNMVMRKWSDRVKRVEEPLFKSYVFVRISKDQHRIVLDTPGVVSFVYWLGKPAVIRDKEIVEIKRFLGEYDDVKVEKLDAPIEPGAKVRITSGVFMYHEATAVRIHKKTIELRLERIGFKLIATFDKRKVEKV